MAVALYPEIWRLMDLGLIAIHPPPERRIHDLPGSPAPFDMCSVSFRLSRVFRKPPDWMKKFPWREVPKEQWPCRINPHRQKSREVIEQLYEKIVLPDGEVYTVFPGDTVVGYTEEALFIAPELPLGCEGETIWVGDVTGVSSLARLFLTIEEAKTIHPAKKPRDIALEIINNGPFPIELEPGLRCCQVAFHQGVGKLTAGVREGEWEGQSATGR